MGAPRTSVGPEDVAFLKQIFAGRARVLEIGTGLGVSTQAIAEVAAAVVTVDIDPWVQQTIWPELPGNVECSSSIPDSGGFDGLFLDGHHSAQAVEADLRACLPLLEQGAPIVLHDWYMGSVREGAQSAGFSVEGVVQSAATLAWGLKRG